MPDALGDVASRCERWSTSTRCGPGGASLVPRLGGSPPGGPACRLSPHREGCEQAVRLGIRAWGSETLGYAAEALARAGDWSAARTELEEALQCTNAIGERQYLTPLLLLDARISDALDEPVRARESTLQAVAEARAQESLWFQVSALSALCEREDRDRQDWPRCVSYWTDLPRSRYGAGRKSPGIAQEDSE